MWRLGIKLLTILKMQSNGITVKDSIGMFKSREGTVNLDLSQLKIGAGPQLVIRKELKRDGRNILRMC
jgi:hypothetical protein